MTTDTSETAGAGASAKATASTAASEGQHVAGVAAGEAQHVAGRAKEQVRGLADQARTEVAGHLDDQTRQGKDRLTGTLSSFGDDLSDMADGGSGLAAQVAREVADRARGLSQHLDTHEPAELLDDVRRFARDRPGTFLLGSLAAGVVVGRLLRGTKDAVDAAEAGATPEEAHADPATYEPRTHAEPAPTPAPAPTNTLGEGIPATATGYSSPPPGVGIGADSEGPLT